MKYSPNKYKFDRDEICNLINTGIMYPETDFREPLYSVWYIWENPAAEYNFPPSIKLKLAELNLSLLQARILVRELNKIDGMKETVIRVDE